MTLVNFNVLNYAHPTLDVTDVDAAFNSIQIANGSLFCLVSTLDPKIVQTITTITSFCGHFSYI